MPYRHAPYYMLVVVAVVLGGFWESYFAVWGSVPWQFHAHGIASSLWVLMVLGQSWLVQKEHLPLHRVVGKSSLLLFPFLIAGLAGIIDFTGKNYVAGNGPVTMLSGPSFMIGLMVAAAAYVTLYFRALKHRRKVWLHAGYMLGTPLILWESPVSRLLIAFVPGLGVAGPADFGNIMQSILWAMAMALLFCIVVRWRVGERAHPFTVTGIFIAAEMVAMGLLGDLAIVRATLAAIGHTPSAVLVTTGFAIGAVTSWAGWQAGKRPAVPAGVAAQPA